MISIPFEEYEKDIEAGKLKERKNEIHEIFTNSNQHCTEEEYVLIEENLHIACTEGDIELINIYLNETISNGTKNLLFKIDRKTQTASLFRVNDENTEDIIIPRTVQHDSTEYLVTSVIGTVQENIKSIKFSENSAIETFYGTAFGYSEIEEIYFPASLKELKEGWCSDTDYLKKISVSPMNNHFVFKEDKYLLGKSDSNQDEFDILLFARRDIEEISIPSNIKIISSYAFANCDNLIKVEIPPNSNLQAIERYAFISTNINEIFIPPKVSKICNHAFKLCENLTKITIPPDSNLQTIEENAFSFSFIEEIYFPSSLKELDKSWCSDVTDLRRIIISPSNGQFVFKDDKYLLGKSNPNSKEFDTLLFASRDIKEIVIPSSIKIISSYAFENCQNFTKVELSPNSKLETIEKDSFRNSKIFGISFPASLRELKEGWCNFTSNLINLNISPMNGEFIFKEDKYLLGKSNPNINEFDTLLFARRDIDEIVIPSSVKIISSYAFQDCRNLNKVEIPPNSNLQTIEKFAFASSSIEEIFLPSKVLKICEFAFFCCINLKKIEIPPNSNLETIESRAFSNSSIEEICIPSKVSIICDSAFDNCAYLTKFGISENSALQIIESNAFYNSKISDFFIPSKVSKIHTNAFIFCFNLQIVEISENSRLKSIPFSSFHECSEFIFMIPSSLRKLFHLNNSI